MSVAKQIIIFTATVLTLCLSFSFKNGHGGNSNHNINNFKRLNPDIEAKTILSQFNGYGVLSTLNRKNYISGYPCGSIVGFSLDKLGKPYFIFSDISLHTRNILKNNSVSLCVTEYGFKSASDSRVSITGDLKKVDDDGCYKEKYLKYHPDADWITFSDFKVYLMEELKDISFIGGFGKAIKIKLEDYNCAPCDPLIFKMDELVSFVNSNFYNLLLEYIRIKLDKKVEKIIIKNLDSNGINIICDMNEMIRIPFKTNVYTDVDLKIAILELLQ